MFSSGPRKKNQPKPRMFGSSNNSLAQTRSPINSTPRGRQFLLSADDVVHVKRYDGSGVYLSRKETRVLILGAEDLSKVGPP